MIFENLHNIRDLKIELVGEDKECILKNCSNLHNILITGIESGQFNECRNISGVGMFGSYQEYLDETRKIEYNVWLTYNEKDIKEFLKHHNLFQVRVLISGNLSTQYGMFSIMDAESPLAVYDFNSDSYVNIFDWKPIHIMLIKEPV